MAVKQLTFLNNNPPAADDDYLNSIVGEVNNTIVASGQTLDNVDLFQLSKSISIATASGNFYQEAVGSAADAYILEPAGSFAAIDSYQDGMIVRFQVVNDNTGASTVQVGTLPAKAIVYSGQPLKADMLSSPERVILQFDAANDRFFFEETLKNSNLFIDQVNATVGIRTTNTSSAEGLKINSSTDHVSLVDESGLTWDANQLSAFSANQNQFIRIENAQTTGGFQLSSYTKAPSGSISAFNNLAYVENEPTTFGAHKLDAYKHNGAGGLTAIANGSRLLSIHNNGVEKARLMGNGDLHVEGDISATGSVQTTPTQQVDGLNTAKAYLIYNRNTSSVIKSKNISSVVNGTTGRFTVNFSGGTFSNANYIIQSAIEETPVGAALNRVVTAGNRATGSCIFEIFEVDSTPNPANDGTVFLSFLEG